jgi:site-specific DNA recombinase
VKRTPTKALRCAVYTRKSTEHGLDQEFSSIDAQREACEAYIKSQASEGWTIVPKQYDDPAYSGGNMQRPALQALLNDVSAGHVDVIVVYKIDRLTRSLADFAKLVEIFEAKSVSFVAVTQQFNTTTSMGRLTLNVLLSFAQFERELSSERVRDKIAASRAKGKWTGGSVPLGYDNADKKLVVNKAEAEVVRTIFSRYLALGSFQTLIKELDQKGIVTKKRLIKDRVIGAIPFVCGPLSYLLKNKVYLGQVGHNGAWFAGQHQPIITKETFDAVQELMKSNSVRRARQRHDNKALLTGFLFDDQGHRMSPTFSLKRGVRYLSYVSVAILKGRKDKAGTVPRVSAPEIERLVENALEPLGKEVANGSAIPPRATLERYFNRIVISDKKIALIFKARKRPIEIPWTIKSSRRTIIGEESAGQSPSRVDQQLIQSVARAHHWVKELSDNRYSSIEEFAKAQNVHPKIVRNRIRLAFLAPEITAAILVGTQPPAVGLRLFNSRIPLSWAAQHEAIQRA